MWLEQLHASLQLHELILKPMQVEYKLCEVAQVYRSRMQLSCNSMRPHDSCIRLPVTCMNYLHACKYVQASSLHASQLECEANLNVRVCQCMRVDASWMQVGSMRVW